MDGRRFFVLLLLVFFLFTTPDPRPSSPLQEGEQRRQKEEEQRALEFIGASRYGDFNSTLGKWLPLAGLTQDDGFSWGLLHRVQSKARAHLLAVLRQCGTQPELIPLQRSLNFSDLSFPVYRNVTSKLRGGWTRWKGVDEIYTPRLNFTSIAARYGYSVHGFGHNVTADHGTLQLNLFDEHTGETAGVGNTTVREITAEMIIQNENQSMGKGWIISLFGVHFPETGAITLSTTSEKFAGLAALPHLAFSGDAFNLSQRLLNKSLSNALLGYRNGPATLFPWSSLPHGPAVTFSFPKCEYIIYLQQHPVMLQDEIAKDGVLRMIEEELRSPRGAPIPSPPPLVMSSVIFSPDCGFVLETNRSRPGHADYSYLSGVKQEEYNKYAGRFITIVAGVLASHVALLMRQVKEASTPSTRSRVSFYTISMMSMGDAIFMSLIVLGLYSEASSLLLTATSFLAFFSVSFLGMKFQIEIWVVQAPERSGSSHQTTTRTVEGTSRSLPAPVTTPRGAGTDAMPNRSNDGQIDPSLNSSTRPPQARYLTESDTGTMYARFYIVLFSLLMFSSWSLFWPSRIRSVYVSALSLTYFSFWSPQIFRNAMRNCRKPLRWEFVFGESFLRFFPLLYFCYVPHNVLFVKISPTVALSLALWVLIQGVFLGSQALLGPRFFVPKAWVPPAYDYHPTLLDHSNGGLAEEPEPAGTLPISSLRAEQRQLTKAADGNKQSDQSRKRVFDCAICMQAIEVPVLLTSNHAKTAGRSIADGTTNLLSRRAYMVTPCQHIFHSTCLEAWMRLRLQCPICRETVPPI